MMQLQLDFLTTYMDIRTNNQFLHEEEEDTSTGTEEFEPTINSFMRKELIKLRMRQY